MFDSITLPAAKIFPNPFSPATNSFMEPTRNSHRAFDFPSERQSISASGCRKRATSFSYRDSRLCNCVREMLIAGWTTPGEFSLTCPKVMTNLALKSPVKSLTILTLPSTSVLRAHLIISGGIRNGNSKRDPSSFHCLAETVEGKAWAVLQENNHHYKGRFP